MKKNLFFVIAIGLLLSGCMRNYYQTGTNAPKSEQDGKLVAKQNHFYLIGNRLDRSTTDVPKDALIVTKETFGDMLLKYFTFNLVQGRQTRIYTKDTPKK